MDDNVPEWISNLSLDIYKLIQQPGSMARLQVMLDKWADGHNADIQKHEEWQERKRRHFERMHSGYNPRLADRDAGPPNESWQWQTSVLHINDDLVSPGQRSSIMVTGWVPYELSSDAEPEIHPPLPLTSDHQLVLEEKYAILAAIYEVGRKGTETVIPWRWPEPDQWDDGAKLYGKPILAVNPFGQQRIAGIVLDNAAEGVGWNKKPVINGIWKLFKDQ